MTEKEWSILVEKTASKHARVALRDDKWVIHNKYSGIYVGKTPSCALGRCIEMFLREADHHGADCVRIIVYGDKRIESAVRVTLDHLLGQDKFYDYQLAIRNHLFDVWNVLMHRRR